MTDHSKEISAFNQFLSRKGNFIKLLILVVILAISIGYVFTKKGKAMPSVKQDCSEYQKIVDGLLDVLNKAPASTSYEPIQSNYHYAVFKEPTLQQVLISLSGDDRTQTIDNGVYVETWNWDADTTKPMTQAQWNKYKDSVILATQKKLDSLKKKQ